MKRATQAQMALRPFAWSAIVAFLLSACASVPRAVPVTSPELCQGSTCEAIEDAEMSIDALADTAGRRALVQVNRLEERPHFPEDLRRRGITTGSVLLSFVLDTTGRVIPESRLIRSATARSFGDSACEFLTRARFLPVRADNRPRRTQVIQGIKFESFAVTRIDRE